MNIKLSQSYSFCQLGVRDNQEDARYPNQDSADNNQRFFVVCDGVGGSDKGELASRTVCDSFAATLKEYDFSIDFSFLPLFFYNSIIAEGLKPFVKCSLEEM